MTAARGGRAPTPLARVFYASAGGADLIASHRHWRDGGSNPDQVSLPFSGEVEDFCAAIGAAALLVSDNAAGRALADGACRIEHIGTRGRSGIGYYAAELRHA